MDVCKACLPQGSSFTHAHCRPVVGKEHHLSFLKQINVMNPLSAAIVQLSVWVPAERLPQHWKNEHFWAAHVQEVSFSMLVFTNTQSETKLIFWLKKVHLPLTVSILNSWKSTWPSSVTPDLLQGHQLSVWSVWFCPRFKCYTATVHWGEWSLVGFSSQILLIF